MTDVSQGKEHDARHTPINRKPMDGQAAPAPEAEPTYELPGEDSLETFAPLASPATDEFDAPLDGRESSANRMGKQIAMGFSAMRDVREAARRHSEARGQLRELQRNLDADVAVLEHRLSIENDYPQIVAAQSNTLSEQSLRKKRAQADMERLTEEKNELQAKLDALKKKHEEELRPYRDLADSTKGRSDDAARALADARRSLKAAERRLNEETRKRDQGISSANRELDNAQARLRDVQSQLEAMSADENTDPEMLARFTTEEASVSAQVSAAQERAARASSEGQQAVERTQDEVYALRRARDQAAATADSAKREATSTREELDQLVRAAESKERQISDQIQTRTDQITKARRDIEDATSRIETAQDLLDEAEAIHNSPQETIGLREKIAHSQEDIEDLQEEIGQLASEEQELRRSTRGHRIMLIAAILIVIAIVVAIVVALLNNR